MPRRDFLGRLLPPTVKKTFVFALGLMLIAELAVKVVSYPAKVEEGFERAEEANLELAQAIATTFHAYLEDVLHLQLAIGLVLASGDPLRSAGYLEQCAQEYPSLRSFAWFDEEGRPRDLGANGASPLAPKLGEEVLGPLRQGRPWVISDLRRGEGAEGIHFLIARGLRTPEGELEGVLAAVVDPLALGGLFSERTKAASIALVDPGGRAVVRLPKVQLGWEDRLWLERMPELAPALAGSNVTGSFRSPLDGVEKLMALVPVKDSGWVAITARPRAEVLGPIRAAVAKETAATLVVALAAFGVALLMGRRVTGPLAQLREQAGAFGQGHFERRVEVSGPSELQSLAATFNHMADQLQDRERRLEDQTDLARQSAAEFDRQAAHLRLVLETMPEGVFLAEAPDGAVMVANSAARKLMGRPLPVGTVIDRQAAAYGLCRPNGKPFRPEELPITRALRGQAVVRQEVLIRRPEGDDVTVMVNCVPMVIAGCIEGAVVVFQDVSPLKEVERVRDEFIHLVSHDLRNPVSAVQAHAELLKRRNELSERDRNSVLAILLAARSLASLTRDLVESARLDSGKLSLVPSTLSLADLLRRQVQMLAPELQDRVRLQLPAELPVVVGDSCRLDRVVANLLSNALKYSEHEVVLSGEPRGAELVVAVKDLGPGIPPEALPQLFQRYYRVPGSRSTEGLGLGLYITRMLVEAHGGRIWVESEVAQGTTFRFSLPVLHPGPPQGDKGQR